MRPGLKRLLVWSTPMWSNLWSPFRPGFIADDVIREPVERGAGVWRARMRLNKSPPTAISASWKVILRAWRTTFALILISHDCSPKREAEAVVEWEAEYSPVADYQIIFITSYESLTVGL